MIVLARAFWVATLTLLVAIFVVAEKAKGETFYQAPFSVHYSLLA